MKGLVSTIDIRGHDGASIQFIYTGKPTVDVSVEGVIKGLFPIKTIALSTGFKSPLEHIKSRRKIFISIAISFLILLFTSILKFVVGAQSDTFELLFMFSVFYLFISLLSLISNIRERCPPFGF